MRKIFDQNRVAPVRLRRRKTWQLILSFILLVAILFTLSFIISYNMLRGDTSSNSAQVADLQQQISDQNDTIDQLRQQIADNMVVATQPPASAATSTPKATAKPGATTKPTVTTSSPTPKPTVATSTPKPAAASATPKPTNASRATDVPTTIE